MPNMPSATPITQAIWQQRLSNSQQQRPNDHRSGYERDRSRILHSAAFRRLQAKTQIQGVRENDFYRTRLTHSLEVSQIGSSLIPQLFIKNPQLSAQLQLDERLMESLCLAHDIGHPPFGHGGEIALHYKMRDHGGFEGNGQTLRILAKLEPYTEHFGMDLTRRTLLGLIKYPNTLTVLNKKNRIDQDDGRKIQAKDWQPPKGIYDDEQEIFNWICQPLAAPDQQLLQDYQPSPDPQRHARCLYKSVDASIMEIADDIAYGVHDLEDAIVVGNISKTLWYDVAINEFKALDDPKITQLITNISGDLFDVHHKCKGAIGQLVNRLVTSIELYPTADFQEPLLKYNARLATPYHQCLEILKKIVFNHVICKPEIQQMEFKGQKIVMDLFDAFTSDPQRLLPHNTKNRWLHAASQHLNPQRVICDYIAGMTDDYASTMYRRLFIA